MANETTSDWAAWRGREVVDTEGTKIGKVEEIFLDDETGQPEWLAVKTGMFGSKHSFVPLAGAGADGETLRVAYPKQKVADAPRIEAEEHMSPEEEAELYRYYGREYGQATETRAQQPATTGQGHDTSGADTDDAMTRSEEELQVGKVQSEAGRARLRKWVETEHVTQTVPVRKEAVTVEREPITDANRDKAMSGKDISEEEHEVVLHEEQAVAQTTVVPKERVRLGTETVTEDQQVEADVRKERIATEGVEDTTRPQ